MSTAIVNVTTSVVTVTSTGSPGRPGVLWDNEGWRDGASYVLDTGLSHHGSSWRAIAAHTGSAATEPGVGGDWPDVWQLLAGKGAQGDKGDMGDKGDRGEAGEQGPPGQWVQMTQSEYDGISPDPAKLYVVIG